MKKVWIIAAPSTVSDVMGVGDATDCVVGAKYWDGVNWVVLIEDAAQYSDETTAQNELNGIKPEKLETVFFIEIKSLYFNTGYGNTNAK